MIQPALTINNTDDQVRNFLIFAFISLICHLVLFAAITFVHFPASLERRMDPPPSIDVDLLAFNPETPLPPARPEQVVSTPADPADQVTSAARPSPVPAAPPPLPVKKGLMKKKKLSDVAVQKPQKPKIMKKPATPKTIDTAKVRQDAVKRIEEQTAAAHSKSVSDRIESLKKEVLEQTGKPSGSNSTLAGSGNAYPKDFSRIEVFQAEVSVRLKNNWVFSEKLAGETRGLESRLVIKVLPDGSITDVWFEKRSGNEYLDNSAYKTVMKSNPLPPLPAGFAYYHLVLGFTPSGLR